MQLPRDKNIVIIDPGLMEAGGHHSGFAAMIANSFPAQRDLQVELVCHELIDSELSELLQSSGCKVQADFTINFYENFKQACKIPDIQPYLLQTSKEYLAAIKNSLERHPGEEIVFFYPTLGWEHAYCLALALQCLPSQPFPVRHIACAMFNPALDHRGRSNDLAKQLNHEIAFKCLNQLDGVQLFASDSELATAYGALLQQAEPLPIHPCYLANWQSLPAAGNNQQAGETLNVIIYMGHAKGNKGFDLLPSLAKEILQHKELNIQLTVQYTPIWADEIVLTAEKELITIAKEDNRLVLYDGFLSDNALHDLLVQADLYVFNYDRDTYQNKNSGLLWMIGWYKIPVLFLNSTWLNREAARMQLPILERTGNWNNLHSDLELSKENSHGAAAGNSSYRLDIYQPFWSWIASI